MVNPTHTSDEELIRAAQGGRVEAFDLLYQRYFPVVYKRVRYVVPQDEVEDVTQEIFIAVAHSLKSFRYEARFSTWLRTLVNRQVADYYRERKPASLSLDGAGAHDQEYLLEVEAHPLKDGLAGTDDQIILRQALQKLSPHYREIILLRFADGLRFEEIARLQCQSLEATKSLFRRAIASLQGLIQDE